MGREDGALISTNYGKPLKRYSVIPAASFNVINNI